jgi:cytochrome c556
MRRSGEGGTPLVQWGILAMLGATVVGAACRQAPTPAPQADMKAIVSIKELMENIIDPIADNIFDAVAIDVTVQGVVETKPTTDEDWAKVRIGAVTLAEGVNLLKIPRPAAPIEDTNSSGALNAPELSPEQVLAKIEQDRAKWNRYADELRAVALEALVSVKTKNADSLFEIGGKLDKACENCHLEYWYPGDRKLVLEDEQNRATSGSKK